MKIKNYPMTSDLLRENKFISGIQFWVNEDYKINFVLCSFNKEKYQANLFSKYNIYFPSAIQIASKKRQEEFLAGRVSAKLAFELSGLVYTNAPTIHIGKHRAPVWPKHVKGSISHAHSKAVCVLGRSKNIQYLGVDIEGIIPTKTATDIASNICNKKELDLLLTQGLKENIATTIIFSAKESLFKALYPYIGEYFGFECAQVISTNLNEGYLIISLNENFYSLYNIHQNYKCLFKLEETYILSVIVSHVS